MLRKTTLTLIITSLVLTVVLPLNAQTKRRRTQTSRKTSQPTSQPRNAPHKSVLSIETGLVVQSGDVKPVARTDFYLLDDSLETVLSNAGLEPQSGTSQIETLAATRYVSSLHGFKAESLTKADEAIAPHIVAKLTTDFSGKGKFPEVTPKTYYLVSIAEVAGAVIIWNMKLDLKTGDSSATLDQNNAAKVFNPN
jgi:hypothetical protein